MATTLLLSVTARRYPSVWVLVLVVGVLEIILLAAITTTSVTSAAPAVTSTSLVAIVPVIVKVELLPQI